MLYTLHTAAPWKWSVSETGSPWNYLLVNQALIHVNLELTIWQKIFFYLFFRKSTFIFFFMSPKTEGINNKKKPLYIIYLLFWFLHSWYTTGMHFLITIPLIQKCTKNTKKNLWKRLVKSNRSRVNFV